VSDGIYKWISGKCRLVDVWTYGRFHSYRHELPQCRGVVQMVSHVLKIRDFADIVGLEFSYFPILICLTNQLHGAESF